MDTITALIAGEKVASGGAPIAIIDPATDTLVAELPEADDATVDRAVLAARRAFDDGSWRFMPVEARQAVLRRCAELIEASADTLADIECTNTGLPLAQIRGRSVLRAADNFRFFADYIGQATGRLYEQHPDYLTMVRREPVGVAALISPWNSPIALGSMKVASAIAFGNSCVLKPSEQAPLGISKLVELLGEAGLPEGVVNLVNGRGATTGDRLIRHPEVDLVSFTGGTPTGRVIMRTAGELLKPAEVELGGKSANIIFDDADFEAALDGALLGIFTNNGQQCLAGSRILVQRGIADRFIEAFVERARRIKVGDPRDPATVIGPMVSQRHMQHVLSFVPGSAAEGELLTGGCRAGDTGAYVEPTLVRAADRDARLFQEEIFGPFAALMVFDTDDEAYALANHSRFGLVSYVWSQSLQRIMTAQERIQAGTVWCNTPMMRELRAPFGGWKESGIGGDGGLECEAFYTRAKTVSIPRRPLQLRKLGA
ncbi:aldehyde dehydrogenase [Sphingomonas sp. HITSZ_GF]|uniref:aldehyde dehydrogenase n=1 Tax=Sphingomonas sp. HITSZ_GF TaxID=3037247 RepID=UPI00240E4ABE|nr:aldehyde dehydrogenase [Sphingomonas sp. HITSZ_GF]MDG2532158.1 aldehyde dehydrogenase [Sphingomonas sp. HITSZ_GF]